MTEYFAEGSPQAVIDERHAAGLLDGMLAAQGRMKRVLLVPPDHTRLHSGAGPLTVWLYERLKDSAHVEVLPALGTHAPMAARDLDVMFPGIPHQAFRVHDWRRDPVHLGTVPADFVGEVTGGRLNYAIDCAVNRLLVEGGWDRIISIGQVVPHEVAGMANHAKNVFIGTGGADAINKTHFIGAACGMEQAMGRHDAPVRTVLNYMSTRFGGNLPLTYLLTVRAKDPTGRVVTRGLFAGDDGACFHRAAELSRAVNIDLLAEPIRKAVVYLDPVEFKSTWLGNKAIYRLRMAIATGGELVILGPAVAAFGEDPAIDGLIRKYGYHGTPRTLQAVQDYADLASNLAAAAHLIHGSSEGRFRITYCPGFLTRAEIEGAGFGFADLNAMGKKYDPARLRDGWQDVNGERIFYVSNPGLGLWALPAQFAGDDSLGA